MNPPRLVVDTNVLVSAMLWGGVPARLIDLAGDATVVLVTSRALLAELEATLGKARLAPFVAATGQDVRSLVRHLRRLTRVVPASALPGRISRDRDDDVVLACASAAKAELIVTGDQDLLVLRSFDGIPIVRPARALQLLTAG